LIFELDDKNVSIFFYRNVTETAAIDCQFIDEVEDHTREEPSLWTVKELQQRKKRQRTHDGNKHSRLPCYRHRRPYCAKKKSACHKSQAVQHWKKRLHFVTLPIFELGNWIPYVLNHWQCFGSSCALTQVTIKNKKGKRIYYIHC